MYIKYIPLLEDIHKSASAAEYVHDQLSLRTSQPQILQVRDY